MYSYKLQHQRLKGRLCWELNTLPTISTLTGCVFSILRRKIDGPDLSKKDIKLPISAPTSHFERTDPFLNRKMKKMMEN